VGVFPNRDLNAETLENQDGGMANLSRSYLYSFLSFITVFTDLGIVFGWNKKSRHKDFESTRSCRFWALARLVKRMKCCYLVRFKTNSALPSPNTSRYVPGKRLLFSRNLANFDRICKTPRGKGLESEST